MMLLIISVFLCLTFVSIQTVTEKGDSFAERRFKEAKKNWSTYLQVSKDDSRLFKLKAAIERTVGVIVAASANNHPHIVKKLQKTVWICVMDSSDDSANNRYKLMLRNFLCYLQYYKIKVLLILLDNSTVNFEKEARNISTIFGDTVTILPYPFHLFWSFVSGKKTVIKTDYNTGDYQGSTPSFKHFGALVTLVPIFEILREGYDVIYFDVDISLLRNPLPFLTLGDADFIASQELRSCDFPSFINKLNDWTTMEPNTGVLYIKSSSTSQQFVRKWIVEMVEQNKLNDQRVLSFHFVKNSVHTTSCNLDREAAISDSKPTKQFKYCFLNEFVFQNGKMEFFCHAGREDQDTIIFPAAYFLGMRQFCPPLGPTHHHHHHPHHFAHGRNSSNHLVFFPALLHVNYCDDKVKLLTERGLFLFNSSRQECSTFQPSKTSFARTDWSGQLNRAKKVAAAELLGMRNGSVVRYRERVGLFFLLADGRLHLLSAGEAALPRYGVKDKDEVQKISRTLFLTLPRGQDLNN